MNETKIIDENLQKREKEKMVTMEIFIIDTQRQRDTEPKRLDKQE